MGPFRERSNRLQSCWPAEMESQQLNIKVLEDQVAPSPTTSPVLMLCPRTTLYVNGHSL